VHDSKTTATPLAYDERFRPQLHFTPPTGWLNDPNGLVYYAGEYHLFYQHFPRDTVWGPMHWGHAVSTDLINWTHLPVALQPDDLGYIFSGSAVIDWHNTAGFGPQAMVVLFTHHDPHDSKQSQSLAYSIDRGRTWTKYAGNPVIDTPSNLRDFRDPKIFWYGDESAGGRWVMALATTSAILFYTSPDLITWQPGGSFGSGYGARSGVWETPDLFQLPVDDGPDTRWVLLAGVGDGAPAGGSGEQYFIGSFDGQTFTSENEKDTVLWFDYGADNYATQSWSDVPHGRRLVLSWMNNWQYGRAIPTTAWRGAMTMPRELRLVRTPSGVRLSQAPAPEFQAQRGQPYGRSNFTVPAGETLLLPPLGLVFELELAVDLPEAAAGTFGLRLRTGADQHTAIGCTPGARTLFIDRRRSGLSAFHDDFPALHSAPLAAQDGRIRLRLFVDRSSVELFANDGTVVLTDQIFPTGEEMQVELFAGDTPLTISRFDAYRLQSARFSK